LSGNIRQLRNITEQISVIEQTRNITADILKSYLPNYANNLPAVVNEPVSSSDFSNEREILYKVLFDMRNDINDLKLLTQALIKEKEGKEPKEHTQLLINKIYGEQEENTTNNDLEIISNGQTDTFHSNPITSYEEAETVEDPISLQEKEFEMIKHALERNNGKRKLAARELGISERTLYRKIKQYDL